MASLKKVDKNLRDSFNKIKTEIFELKKSKKSFSKYMNQLTMEQVKMSSLAASKEDVNELERDVDVLRNSQELLSDLPEDVLKLKKELINKNEFEREIVKQDIAFSKLSEDVKKLKNSKDEVKLNKVKEIENKIVPLEEIRSVILEDVNRKYYTTEEVTKQLNELRKEVNKMSESFVRVRKNVIVFPRLKIFSNMFLLLSLISFSGAAVSVYLEYAQSANFLAIEGGIFLIFGLFVKLITLLRE